MRIIFLLMFLAVGAVVFDKYKPTEEFKPMFPSGTKIVVTFNTGFEGAYGESNLI